jgi:quercetin dioxygenase-like cupin family protein
MAATELPAGEPIGLLDLISYQDAAVVSRTLLRRSTGTVTLFAFDQGQGLSEHTASFDALVYVLEGDAEVILSGQAHRVVAGQIMVMPAHEPHAVTARTQFKMLLTMIRQASPGTE